VVAGALAIDLACDYTPASANDLSPQLHTSNPCKISQTLGGVAHNISRAAHYVGARTMLCSAVGNDILGRAVISQLSSDGLRVSGISTLDQTATHRTAQYVAINDAEKNLTLAMADMSILEAIPESEVSSLWHKGLRSNPPKVLVVDGNWSPRALHTWFDFGRTAKIFTVFEPVSVAKSSRIFHTTSTSSIVSKASASTPLPLYPNNIIDLATPNSHELASIYTTASSLDLFSSTEWFTVIDSLGIPSSGLRTALATITSSAMVDEGIPQRAIQLLPYIPAILTKLGPKGVLLTKLLPLNDERLYNADDAPYVLARCKNGSKEVGGLYVRLFEPEEVLGAGEVVSVNGAGDTLLGVLVAGMVKGKKMEDVIGIAQKAANMTLRSAESVAPSIKNLSGKFTS
jgi:pseudouridylate synthase / pseudouridine kinase